jgi:hypothetical protein
VSAPADHTDIVVNDRFWLRRARAAIETAHAPQVAAAERLQTAVAWFWSIGTAAVLALVLAGWLGRTTSLCLIVPALILIAAYWSANHATMPIPLRGDPRSPAMVEREALAAFALRQSRLDRAHLLVAAAALALLAAIALAAVLGRPGPVTLAAAVRPGQPAVIAIVLRGVPDGETRIAAADSRGQVVAARTLRATGRMARMSLPIPALPRLELRASWSEAEGRVARSLTIHAPPLAP